MKCFKIVILEIIVVLTSIQAQNPTVYINEFLASNSRIYHKNDLKEYSDWIEIYNDSDNEINLNGYYITDNLEIPSKWVISEDLRIPPKGFITFCADGEDYSNHTNFKIEKDGEQLGLYSPNLTPIDTFSFHLQYTDISYGRSIQDSNEWLFYDDPTPGEMNDTKGLKEPIFCNPPVFSNVGGFYFNDINIELNIDEGDEIRYTLDGSEPNKNSLLYNGLINIVDKSYGPYYYSNIPTNINTYAWIQPWHPPREAIRQATIIRAKTFSDDKLNSKIVTNTFFIGQDIKNAYDIPIVSIISDGKHIFSDSLGIYVPGDRYNGTGGTGNYFFDWNRPAHFQYFDENGELCISQEVDIRTQGLSSQANSQKGLHIIAREKYGVERLYYPFFKEYSSSTNDIESYKRIMARAWGSNWQYAMLSDAYAHTIYSHSSLDIQAYRPVIVFVNGEYWGIQELREANKNPYYFEDHYGIDVNNPGLDILQSRGEFIDEGDDLHWNTMINFISTNEISDENYEILNGYMDISNFIDYIGHTVFCNKFDWPGQNEAFWRKRTSNGRWKWIQYDMDTSFGLHGSSVEYDMIRHVIHGGTNNKLPHPILIKLLENNKFKSNFINWFMDRFNSDFRYEILKEILDSMVAEISPYIPEHRDRWSMNEVYDWLSWEYNINIIYIFVELRQNYVIEHLMNEFNLNGLVDIDIGIDKGGIVQLNTIKIEPENNTDSLYVWNGKYFKEIEISLKAIPNAGYTFEGWEGDITTSVDSINIVPNESIYLRAKFSPTKIIENVFINEVYYSDNNSAIEILNSSNDTIKTNVLFITDDSEIYVNKKLSELDSTINIIPPNFYQVININNLRSTNVNDNNVSINQNEGLFAITQISGKDTIIVDSVNYPYLSSSISYGRYPDASDNWKYLPFPTLGYPNNSNIGNNVNFSRSTLIINYPNPFITSTTIPIFLVDNNNYKVKIFDINGITVKEYNIVPNVDGVHSIFWDGYNSNNKLVSSGIYFYTLFKNDKPIDTKKMLFLK